MQCIILIPSYEPDDKLINLLKTIEEKADIIIINDGSDKSYNKIFEEAKKYATVLSYKNNKGKGFALKKGLKYIKDKYHDYVVVTMDSDGQHTIKDAMNLYNYAKDNKETLVLGKRTWNKSNPLKSRIGNSITRKVYKLMTGLTIYDTQTGLRAFSNKLIDYMLNIPGDRYEYEMNVLLNLKNNHIPYKEIDIETIYINNNETSHFNSIKDSYKIYKNIFNWKKNH